MKKTLHEKCKKNIDHLNNSKPKLTSCSETIKTLVNWSRALEKNTDITLRTRTESRRTCAMNVTQSKDHTLRTCTTNVTIDWRLARSVLTSRAEERLVARPSPITSIYTLTDRGKWPMASVPTIETSCVCSRSPSKEFSIYKVQVVPGLDIRHSTREPTPGE